MDDSTSSYQIENGPCGSLDHFTMNCRRIAVAMYGKTFCKKKIFHTAIHDTALNNPQLVSIWI